MNVPGMGQMRPLFLPWTDVEDIHPAEGNMLVRPIKPSEDRRGLIVRQATECNWQECEVVALAHDGPGEGLTWKCAEGDHILIHSRLVAATRVDHGKAELAIINGQAVEAVVTLRADKAVVVEGAEGSA